MNTVNLKSVTQCVNYEDFEDWFIRTSLKYNPSLSALNLRISAGHVADHYLEICKKKLDGADTDTVYQIEYVIETVAPGRKLVDIKTRYTMQSDILRAGQSSYFRLKYKNIISCISHTSFYIYDSRNIFNQLLAPKVLEALTGSPAPFPSSPAKKSPIPTLASLSSVAQANDIISNRATISNSARLGFQTVSEDVLPRSYDKVLGSLWDQQQIILNSLKLP